MKRLFVSICLITCGLYIAYADSLTENFEQGLPASAPSSETAVSLSSGVWRLVGVYGKKDNNSERATMSSAGSYIETPALYRPGSLNFKFRGSGNGKQLLIQKSSDRTHWSEVGTAVASSSSTYGSGSYSLQSQEGDTAVYVRFTCQNATIYLDDIQIALGTTGGGQGGGEEPVNPEPQDTLVWEGTHSTEHCLYVATWGNDSGDGSWEHPFYNLQKAVDTAVPGDTIYVRGGTYYPTMKADGSKTTVRITKSGTASARYTIKTFPGEFPVLNFKDQPKKESIRGIFLGGDYWHIYGLHITRAGDNGIKLEGSHNIIERCTFSYNDDTGLQLGFGHKFSDSHPGISSNDGSYCAYNDIIDCDSYLNCDSDNFGSDADGFACKMHNGKGNRFIRCRAWDNSDDAWDLYETDFGVQLIECWAWGSGRAGLFDWVEASGSFQGNGNGIKLGGNGTGGSSKGVHEAWNCVAFNNNKTGSVKGFDENSHKDGVKLVNCLAFGNGYDFMFEDCEDSAKFEFYNNVCLGRIEIKGRFTDSHNALTAIKNAWSNQVVNTGFSEADYISLSEEDAKAPRGVDGSLPTRFARLRSTSVLIDKGLDLRSPLYEAFPFTWQPVSGPARDLGPYEYEQTPVAAEQVFLGREETLSLVVADGQIVFTVPCDGLARLELFSLQGRRVESLRNLMVTGGARYHLPWQSAVQPGLYVVRLSIGGRSVQQKVIVR